MADYQVHPMTSGKGKPGDLREACIREALAIIEVGGVESLSLREVARRLGVSHQAPYKHFPDRDHILAEIVRRAFESFATYLDSRPLTGDPINDMHEMGMAYLRYARTHPLQYRLMFSTPLPDPAQHPQMMQSARHAFDLLQMPLICFSRRWQPSHTMQPTSLTWTRFTSGRRCMASPVSYTVMPCGRWPSMMHCSTALPNRHCFVSAWV